MSLLFIYNAVAMVKPASVRWFVTGAITFTTGTSLFVQIFLNKLKKVTSIAVAFLLLDVFFKYYFTLFFDENTGRR